MKIGREDIKRMLGSALDYLTRAEFDTVSGLSARLKNLIPFGTFDRVQHTSLFGFISKPVPGVIAYFKNLHGNAQAPTVIAHLHSDRPEPAVAGETIIYCTDSTGKNFPVKMYLMSDGTLKFNTTGEMKIISSKVRLGKENASNPLVLGNDLVQALTDILTQLSSLANTLSTHTHSGNLGYPTSPPTQAASIVAIKTQLYSIKSSPVSDGGLLSTISFTEKN